MTRVRFWNEVRDLKAEYLYLKKHRPAEADAIRDAIALVLGIQTGREDVTRSGWTPPPSTWRCRFAAQMG